MGAASLRHKIARYEEVKRSGVDFILEHENPDGSFGPVENGFFFYRLPWTFLVAGEDAGGSRHLPVGTREHAD